MIHANPDRGLEDLGACAACGAVAQYKKTAVLWPELIREWGLSDEEAAVLDHRDSVVCTTCGVQLRNMTLALSVMRAVGVAGPFVRLRRYRPLLRVLELNECGALRQMMRRRHMLRKVSGDYPDVDMQALPYANQSFDLIMHGDTLEHVPDPLQGLRECSRVLRPGGALCYTVPVVVGRPTRRRDGLPASYHGRSDDAAYLVFTEYGDDFWQQPLLAGFRSVEVVTLLYPASFALVCRL